MIALEEHPTNTALHALLSGAGPAQLPGTFCDHCGKTAEQASVTSLKTCGACHGMRYCSAACQKAAWPAHKAACKARAAEREEATKVNIHPLPK
jgi:MYND finger